MTVRPSPLKKRKNIMGTQTQRSLSWPDFSFRSSLNLDRNTDPKNRDLQIAAT